VKYVVGCSESMILDVISLKEMYGEWIDRNYLFQNKEHGNETSGFINNGQFA